MQKDDGLPSVNKDLFMKLKTVTDKSEEVDSKKKRVNKKQAAKQERSNTILKDERFSKLFTEKEFQVRMEIGLQFKLVPKVINTFSHSVA